MDKKEFYNKYLMPKENTLRYSLPYFASKENQTLYVMVPTVNPMGLNNIQEDFRNIGNHSTAEEILPDFRCKICSVTIFNYSDFKIHEQIHKKTAEGILGKSSCVETHEVVGLENAERRPKSNHSDVIKKNVAYVNTKYSSDLINRTTNLMLPSEVLSKPSLESCEKAISSSKQCVTSNNSATALKNFKVPIYAKHRQDLKWQNKILDEGFVKPKEEIFSFDKTLNKSGGYMLTAELPHLVDDSKDNFKENKVSYNKLMNFGLPNASVKILTERRLEEDVDTPAAEPSTSNTKLILTYTGLKELPKKTYIKTNAQNYASSTLQSQLVKQNTDASTEVKKINLCGDLPESSFEKSFFRTMNIFNPHFASQPLTNVTTTSTYSKSKIFTEDNITGSTACYSKSNISGKNPLPSTASEHRFSILQPLFNAKNKTGCIYCGKICVSRIELTKHLAKHQFSKAVSCVLCKSLFFNVSSLRKHLLMIHCDAKDRRQCSHCSYRCFQTSDLEKHIARRHTRDFKYKCFYCTKGFTTPKELHIHATRYHSY